PAYRHAARRITAALADRYAHHPALALWHVHNEYGTTCHCPHTEAAFRRWLADRHGDLDTLNDAWATSFWSQHYTDWTQIGTPRATQYLHNPGHLLDFRRFWSDTLLAAYTEQRDLLRTANPDVPVTTNYVLGDWVPVDHGRWSREVDLVAVDHYPSAVDRDAETQAALAADTARGWSRHGTDGRTGDWLLMETAPNLIYTDGRMHTKEPGRMLRQSVAHVARGSRGALFFQWRAPRGGAERFHSALVGHAGADSRVYREAVRLGHVLDRLAEVRAPVAATVAVTADAASGWALRHPGMPSTRLDHHGEVAAAHGALWRAGITCDVVAAGDRLDGYRLLVVPALYLVDDRVAAWVRDHVHGGGYAVVTYLSGVADEHARVRLGGYPGALRDVLGIRVEEFHPLAVDERIPLTDGSTGTVWSETVHLTGATAVTAYATGVLQGCPAVTRHRYGAGVAWYVSTRLDDDTYQRLLTGAAHTAGVTPVCPGTPHGVEAVRRSGPEGSWLFLLNHTDRPQTVPAAGTDLLTGVTATDSVDLPAGGVAVLREPATPQ
ncbi:beta-galactosidase, partial [Micromonospora sp. NPDC000207]|uniref:beta-galactosidase n=1 Tax=Micromonospora sp. NPDC000207 TaxID=3154246 RepID=UPI00331C4A7D